MSFTFHMQNNMQHLTQMSHKIIELKDSILPVVAMVQNEASVASRG